METKFENKTKEETLYDILKVNTVSYLLCNTNLGDLKKCYRKGGISDYFYTLDSVILEDREVIARLDDLFK